MAKKPTPMIVDPPANPPVPDSDYIFSVSEHEDENGYPLFVFEILYKPEEL